MKIHTHNFKVGEVPHENMENVFVIACNDTYSWLSSWVEIRQGARLWRHNVSKHFIAEKVYSGFLINVLTLVQYPDYTNLS